MILIVYFANYSLIPQKGFLFLGAEEDDSDLFDWSWVFVSEVECSGLFLTSLLTYNFILGITFFGKERSLLLRSCENNHILHRNTKSCSLRLFNSPHTHVLFNIFVGFYANNSLLPLFVSKYKIKSVHKSSSNIKIVLYVMNT